MKDIHKLKDKAWRVSHLYKIRDKNEQSVTFKPNRAQLDFIKNRTNRNIILKSRQLGFCLDPGTRVLTAELRWVKIKELLPGDAIIGVDEFPPGGRGKARCMRTGYVKKVVFLTREAYRISFDDGRSVICTGKHPWLSKKVATDAKWRTIEKTKKWRGVLKVGSYVRWIAEPWQENKTFEDGWVGGMLDGEGSMSKPTAKKAPDINCSQRSGDVLDRLIKYFKNFTYRLEIDKRTKADGALGDKSVTKVCLGRMNEIFELLGTTRPSRFLGEKWRFWEGRALPGKKTGIGWAKITKIEKIGTQTMVDLQTSIKTYIAEGFVSHNTTFEAIDMLDDCLFKPNFTGVLIAHTKEDAIEIFKSKISYAWENFPLKNLYTVKTERANELKFGFGDGTYSSIRVTNSGRSITANRIHASELGKLSKKFPERAQEFLTGTIPSVPTNGRIDIESTAEGDFGHFYDTYMNAKDKPMLPTEFKRHFYNWTWDDAEIALVTDEQVEYSLKQDDYSFFLENIEQGDLSDREKVYYYLKWLGLSKNFDALRQEYPTTVEEAFEYSGNRHFTTEILDRYELRDGVEEGDLTIFEEWKTNGTYLIGADVAGGVGRDHSTAVVLKITDVRSPIEVVATYKCNTIDPTLFAHELKGIAVRYKGALVCPEVNNHGHATLAKLISIYPNVYRHTVKDVLNPLKKKKIYGWLTTVGNKGTMLGDLKEAITNGLLYIPSKELIHELKSYDRDDIAEMKNETGHWDLVIACFVKNTLILTDKGQVPIQSLKVGDKVKTRKGYRRIISTVAHKKKVITKLGVTGTSDHPIITQGKVKDLTDVCVGDILTVWNIKKQQIEKLSYTKAKHTLETQLRNFGNIGSISSEKVSGKSLEYICTDVSISTILEKYQKVLSYITLTTTRLTTSLKTWWRYLYQTTLSCICQKTGEKSNQETISMQTEKKLMKGLGNTTKIKSPQSLAVIGAVKSFWRKLTMLCSAHTGATEIGKMKGSGCHKKKRPAQFAKRSSKPQYHINCDAQKNAVEIDQDNIQTVYNIQVEGEEEYFANNLLVHNCSISWQMVSKVAPPTKPEDPTEIGVWERPEEVYVPEPFYEVE